MDVNDAMGNGLEGSVMRDEHDRTAMYGRGILQKLQDGLARLVVERTRRLVAEQELGILGKSTAIATRCCSPPESCAGKLSMRLESPTMASASSAGSGSSQICAASSTFSSAVRFWTRL